MLLELKGNFRSNRLQIFNRHKYPILYDLKHIVIELEANISRSENCYEMRYRQGLSIDIHIRRVLVSTFS